MAQGEFLRAILTTSTLDEFWRYLRDTLRLLTAWLVASIALVVLPTFAGPNEPIAVVIHAATGAYLLLRALKVWRCVDRIWFAPVHAS